MIALLTASTIVLAVLQAAITAPTDAFRNCLHEATDKAGKEKVAGDAYEAYARNACSVQMDSLKSALVAFRMKNGMLLDELEETQEIARLLEGARDAPGCRIFIGSENRMSPLLNSAHPGIAAGK